MKIFRPWLSSWPTEDWNRPAASALPTRCCAMNKAVYTRDFSDLEVSSPLPVIRHRGHEHSMSEAGPYSGPRRRVFTIGIGGPVGSGKTALVERLCREFWPAVNLA